MDQETKIRIAEELGGLPVEVIDELLGAFFTQTEGEMTCLKEAMGRDDIDSIMKIAHSIKGAAGNLRVNSVQELARIIEMNAKEGYDKALVEATFTKLEAKLIEEKG
jgi:two-component system, sensor histidine kinase and response regulator